MFTGIIQSTGTVKSLDIKQSGDVRIAVAIEHAGFRDITVGESISVNGVCLTVTEFVNKGFYADVSNETLSCTALSDLKESDQVNLERSLLPTTRLGGHFVSGHVDGVGEISGMTEDADSTVFSISVPQSLVRFIAVKGSVSVDGVSLTINTVDGTQFSVNIIPHTMEHTIISNYSIGQRVNIEVDLVARYLDRLVRDHEQSETQKSNISYSFLVEHGFADKN
ncbi:MAG: riboflavin synthase [Gammaproteobacteria bacterium]